MALYPFTVPGVNHRKLYDECTAAGLSVASVIGGAIGSPAVSVVTAAPLLPAAVVTLTAVVAAHDGRPRVPRLVQDVATDIAALSPAQLQALLIRVVALLETREPGLIASITGLPIRGDAPPAPVVIPIGV